MRSLQFNMFSSHLLVALFLLIGTRISMVRTLQLSSRVETSLEEKLNATFSSADNLQWDIQSQNTTFLKLKVDRIYVNNNLTYPGNKLSLLVYGGSCSQGSNQLTEKSQSFTATSNGHLCLFYPATKDSKNITIFITINTVNVTAQFYEKIAGCGKRQVAFQPNIFNGNVVRSSLKWPWIVSLYKSDSAHCAGAILNEHWILTAAHCVRYERLFLWETARAGNSKRADGTVIEVSEMFRHPKFDRFFNDIAMIRIKTPLTMSDTIQPICFKDFDMESLQDCYTAGWGVTGPEENRSTEELNEAKVYIWDKDSCRNIWGNDFKNISICARGDGTACLGDSGSPLMCSDQSGSRWSVVGVTSFGTKCGVRYNVPVYTKVSSFTDWIQQTMNNFPENYPKCSLDYPSLCSPNNFLEKSNNYLELPEFSCNFNNASTCNYKLNGEAKWTTKSDPLDPKNSYLVIKNSYRETTYILSPYFNKNVGSMTDSMCLSFIYKIQSEYRAQITVLTEGTSRFNERNIVWISKKIGHWDKVRIILNDPRIFQFYLKIYSNGNAVYSIDDISLIDGKC